MLRKSRDIGIYTQRFGFCDLSGFCSLGTFVPVGDSSDYRFALAARHPACLRQEQSLTFSVGRSLPTFSQLSHCVLVAFPTLKLDAQRVTL